MAQFGFREAKIPAEIAVPVNLLRQHGSNSPAPELAAPNENPDVVAGAGEAAGRAKLTEGLDAPGRHASERRK